MKQKYAINVRGTRATHETPPLYRAVCDQGLTHGPFTTLDEAKSYLLDVLEEFHESIAFESDRHHIALDERFYSRAYVEAY